jgi:hypothetical protein
MDFSRFSLRESEVPPAAALPPSANEVAATAAQLKLAADRVKIATARLRVAEKSEAQTVKGGTSVDGVKESATAAASSEKEDRASESGPLLKAKAIVERRRRTLARFQEQLHLAVAGAGSRSAAATAAAPAAAAPAAAAPSDALAPGSVPTDPAKTQ